MTIILDIGGEGRNPEAWNLNPRRFKSIGPEIGQPIPRLIWARGEFIPFGDRSVDIIIVERTPLRSATLAEMQRIIKPGGTIILRHARPHHFDPHRFAIRFFQERQDAKR